jgi:hypothetical protein
MRGVAQDSELTELEHLEDDEAMELLTARTMPAFRNATVKNFPGNYIKKSIRVTNDPDTWILLPRKAGRKLYKKYSKTFNVPISPQMAKNVETFGDTTLEQFFQDNLTVDHTNSINAKVHLYEAIPGTWLSKISANENIPGLGTTDKSAWSQIHPLTESASSLLLGEVGLGNDDADKFKKSRSMIKVGQRFYYLEIPGSSVKKPVISLGNNTGKTRSIIARNSDFQIVLDFIKSRVEFNYFFSEADANFLTEKINTGDRISIAEFLRKKLKDAFKKVLIKKVGSKVKIIHEAVPEIYLDRGIESEEFFGSFTKGILRSLVKSVSKEFAEAGYKATKEFFKTRYNEFKTELAKQEDGVTIQIVWSKVSGMRQIHSVISAIRGKGSIMELRNLRFPSIDKPDISIKAGKNFK